MARLLTCGFELGSALVEVPNIGGGTITHLTGTPTIDTGTVRSDSRSLKIDLTAGGQQVRIGGFSGLEAPSYMRVYARFQAFPSSGAAYIMGRPSGVGIKINSSGQLEAWFNNVTLTQLSSALSLNTWYRIEMLQTIRAAATDDIEYRVDGTSWYTSTGVERASANSSNFDLGHNAAAGGCIYYLDDLAANDSTGSDQNSWPGEGRVFNLLPISDNARSGYTGGAGATTNLFAAVDNQPPTGTTAAADTDTTQIKGTGNNTTDSYSPNLETPNAAGVPEGERIALAQAWHRFANATILTTRQQGIQGTTPAITEAVANQSGIVSAAEISTSWLTRSTAPIYNPVMDRATSPVIRTRKATASTNEHAVDAMGMYVESVPAPQPDFNGPNWAPGRRAW